LKTNDADDDNNYLIELLLPLMHLIVW